MWNAAGERGIGNPHCTLVMRGVEEVTTVQELGKEKVEWYQECVQSVFFNGTG